MNLEKKGIWRKKEIWRKRNLENRNLGYIVRCRLRTDAPMPYNAQVLCLRVAHTPTPVHGCER